nr:hypothetical protein Iba_chr09cCG8280 [Ipomoea batatas]
MHVVQTISGPTWPVGLRFIVFPDLLTATVVPRVTLALPGQACGGRRILHRPGKIARLMRGLILTETLIVPVAVMLAFNTTTVNTTTDEHSNEAVTFGAAGVPVLPQTRAPFKFTVMFSKLAADGAVNAAIATHKNIQNAAYQEQPIVLYTIIF